MAPFTPTDARFTWQGPFAVPAQAPAMHADDGITDDWYFIAADVRVADPEEDRDEAPWEWRSNEMTLAGCKADFGLGRIVDM